MAVAGGSAVIAEYRGGSTRAAPVGAESLPSKAKKRSEKASIYVAGEQGGGLTKVGYSENPIERVGIVAAIGKMDLVLWFMTKPLRHAVRIEHIAHRILAPYQKSPNYWIGCNTEWFNVTPEVARRAVLEAIKLANACKRMRELGLSLGQWSWE